MSTLYVIATPIGNLEDITFRAVKILKEVDVVLCEDTRTTKKLLDAYGISATTVSYNAHASEGKHDHVIELLQEGKNIALVSDAGTPGISDPGCLLVEKVYHAFPNGEVEIKAIPGASAVVSALSISGFPVSDFTFLGFLPHKKGRETLFGEIAVSERTMVFYESPHRILKTLASLAQHSPLKKIAIARELTKIYEEVVRGTAEELLAFFAKNPEKVRGEFVVIVSA